MAASAPNAVFCLDNAAANTFGRLFGPTVAIPAGATYVDISFDTQYDLEQQNDRVGFDAFSFGYRLDGVGGTRFATSDAIEFDHRYTHYVVRASGDQSGDRSGWSGNSGGYRHARIRIPDLAGHTITPRFDLTTDDNTGNVGVFMDNVVIEALTIGCGPCTPAAVADAPGVFRFRVAGPNPFQERTALHYTLTQRALVRVEVFGVTGERVRTLVNRVMEPGNYDVSLDVRAAGQRPLGSGVYWARLIAGVEVRTLRVVALE
jgi:hypothetical protein